MIFCIIFDKYLFIYHYKIINFLFLFFIKKKENALEKGKEKGGDLNPSMNK